MSRVRCPKCQGEGEYLHRIFAAGASPYDHDDDCDLCTQDSDGIHRVTERQWEQWVQHPTFTRRCRRAAA